MLENNNKNAQEPNVSNCETKKNKKKVKRKTKCIKKNAKAKEVEKKKWFICLIIHTSMSKL